MVAYNFKKRFAPLIESGKKRQTIRALGKRRHAQRGDVLTLYTGQRTKACRKLLETICTYAIPIEMDITPEHGLSVFLDGIDLDVPGMIALAELDGFGLGDDGDPLDEFIRFFEDRMPFEGIVIEWKESNA